MPDNIRMLNLKLNELKLIAKGRGITCYESKSEDNLIKILCEPKPKTISLKRKYEVSKKILVN